MRTTLEELDVTIEIPLIASRGQMAYAGPQTGLPRRQPTSGALMFTLVTLLISAVGLLYLMQTSRVATLGFEASRLQRERQAQSLANEQLSYGVARYESLPLVERVARDQLGMQPMRDYRYLDVARPASDELALSTPEATAQASLFTRIVRRVTGRAAASHNAGDGQ